MNGDVAASVDRIRRQVDTAMWAAVGLGLAFTMVNVQVFAAAGAATWSLSWVVAWLLDPMVSILLIAVLRAEQVTARWQVPMGWQVTATKWGAFAATYAMNTWQQWRDQVPSGVVLHSVPPLVVLLGAEVAPVLRDRLTEAVAVASRHFSTPVAAVSVPSHAVTAPEPVAPAIPDAIPDASEKAPETLSEPSPNPRETHPVSEPGSVRIPNGSDAERVADLRKFAAEFGRMPGRDTVKSRYGVGSSVANRLREQAAKPQLTLTHGGA